MHMMKMVVAGFAVAAWSGMPVAGMPFFAATTRYVVPAGTEGNTPASPYDSPATAANDLATVIEAAEGGDTVLVYPGTYDIESRLVVDKKLDIRSHDERTGGRNREETVLDGGGKTSIMTAKKQYLKISGFTFANAYASADTLANNPSSGGAALSILANDITVSDCVFRSNSSSNVIGTCIFAYQCHTPVITGCVFSNNTQYCENFTAGTAIYLYVSTSTHEEKRYAKISDCIFRDNRSTGGRATGSVLYARTGRTVIDRCRFLENSLSFCGEPSSSSSGGNIYLGVNSSMNDCFVSCNAVDLSDRMCYGSLLWIGGTNTIRNCTFTGVYGPESKNLYGIIAAGDDKSSFIGCRITGNSVCDGYGLIYSSQNGLLFRNCLVAGNSRQGDSCFIVRHVCRGAQSGLTMENCTFADNGDSSSAGTFGFSGKGSDAVGLVNSVFTAPVEFPEAVAASVTNCCFAVAVPEGITDGGGNFTSGSVQAIGFQDAENGNYALKRYSPLREKALPLSWMADAFDIDGNPRIVSRHGKSYASDPTALPDIGCHECVMSVPGLAFSIR